MANVQPSWKDSVSVEKPDARTAKGWQQSPRPTAIRRPWGRRARIVVAVSLLAAVAAAFTAVLLWPRPAPPVRLVLIGAGYETNLAVPHNVWGRRGLRDLERWAQDYIGRSPRGHSRIEVRREELSVADDAVARALEGCRAPVVVVFLAAHGGADEEGAFLVPHDTDLSRRASLYRLDRVLDALAGLP